MFFRSQTAPSNNVTLVKLEESPVHTAWYTDLGDTPVEMGHPSHALRRRRARDVN